MKYKKCSVCEKEKSLRAFPHWRTVCKKCVKVERHEQYLNWYANYKPSILKRQAEYYAANTEKVLLQNSLWRKENRPKMRAYNSVYTKKYPERKNAITAKRRAAKLNRIPKWLTKADWIEIKWAYAEAKRLTKESGVLHVVDHIIPLQGEQISGLHCPQNLQILTDKENSKKKNKFPCGELTRGL